MGRTVIITLMACICFVVVNAQVRNCGTNEYMQQQLAKNEAWKQTLNQFDALPENNLMLIDTITIPVVVHVVYNTTSQNISDQQIQSQIDVLNEDFNAYNSDLYLLPTPFKSVIGKSYVFFCLAALDPDSNPTTGITRTQTQATSFYFSDSIKFDSLGGHSAWDANRYLNMWVGNLSNNLLGYATLPGGPEVIDGVVIRYTAFGRTGTLIAPYNKGRTATHEVGHWLNLKHIWGDSFCGTDNVGDTPKQQTANYGCPNYPHVTCSNGPNGDMFMNYMDYTDDNCMYVFTDGQCTRMLNAINQFRPELLNQKYCNYIAPPVDTTSEIEAVTMFYDLQNAEYYLNFQADVERTDLDIYNVLGQKVNTIIYENNIAGEAIPLNMEQYANGIYIVTIRYNDKSTTYKIKEQK